MCVITDILILFDGVYKLNKLNSLKHSHGYTQKLGWKKFAKGAILENTIIASHISSISPKLTEMLVVVVVLVTHYERHAARQCLLRVQNPRPD